MISQDSVYRIGKLGKTHGVKGEITFFFDDDIFDRVDSDFLILKLDGILVPFYMEEYRFRSDEVALVKFESVDTQTRAAELTGTEVYFPVDAADGDEESLSVARIAGFVIEDASTGLTVGRVARVDNTTANMLFELEDGKLIPVAEDWIKEIDKDNRLIRMSLPEGLLDL